MYSRKRGCFGLVHERQVELGEVGDLDVEAAVLTRDADEPVGHRQPGPAGARAGDDDSQQRHACTVP